LNSTTDYPGFLQVAEQIGLTRKLLYTLKEVSQVTGVPYRTLLAETYAGRLRCMQTEMSKTTRYVRPEWVDEWIERSVENA
jgi:predicted site-specific integrase-resolvase